MQLNLAARFLSSRRASGGLVGWAKVVETVASRARAQVIFNFMRGAAYSGEPGIQGESGKAFEQNGWPCRQIALQRKWSQPAFARSYGAAGLACRAVASSVGGMDLTCDAVARNQELENRIPLRRRRASGG